MTIYSIVLLFIALLNAMLFFIIFIKIKSIYLNLYNLSKGLDILWGNQQKIIELTKIKGFVQLTNEEERFIRKEISEEKKFGRRSKESVRPPEFNPDNQTA